MGAPVKGPKIIQGGMGVEDATGIGVVDHGFLSKAKMFIEPDGSLVIHGHLSEDFSNIELVKRVVEGDKEHSSVNPSWMKFSHVHVDRAAQSSPIREKHATHKVTS